MTNVLERFDMYMGNFKCVIRKPPFPGKPDSFFKSTNCRGSAYPLLFLHLLCLINTLTVELCFYLLAGTVKTVPEGQYDLQNFINNYFYTGIII